MKVYKFGGASVRNADGVRNLRRIAGSGSGLFIIVSAMGKTTNALEEIFALYGSRRERECMERIEALKAFHYAIIADLFGSAEYRIERVDAFFGELARFASMPPSESMERDYDAIVSFGELVSTAIVSEYLNASGVANTWTDMRTLFVTDARHKDANIRMDESCALFSGINRSGTYVGQGFIGRAPDGSTTTLGREGSDYSAAVAANLLDAESMTVWKDVDGILTADPKIFSEACKIDALNYTDTLELAYSGAQIIHPKTIKPLQAKHIPLYVRPFGNMDGAGTVINGDAPKVNVPIIILKRNQSVLKLRSRDLTFVLEEKFPTVFSTLERFRIKTNLIHNTAIELSLCVDDGWHLNEAAKALNAEGFDTEITGDAELLTIRNCDSALREKYTRSEANLIGQTAADTIRIVRRRSDGGGKR